MFGVEIWLLFQMTYCSKRLQSQNGNGQRLGREFIRTRNGGGPAARSESGWGGQGWGNVPTQLRKVGDGSKSELQGGGGEVERGLAALSWVIGRPGVGTLCPEHGSKGESGPCRVAEGSSCQDHPDERMSRSQPFLGGCRVGASPPGDRCVHPGSTRLTEGQYGGGRNTRVSCREREARMTPYSTSFWPQLATHTQRGDPGRRTRGALLVGGD